MCTLQLMPGLRELKLDSMSGPSSSNSAPPRTDGEMAIRSSLPSRPASKADIELAEHLVDHAQGYRDMSKPQSESTDSRPLESRSFEGPRSVTPGSISFDHSRHLTPRSAEYSGDEHERPANPPSDATPNGQICR